jgi:hypothetical protein
MFLIRFINRLFTNQTKQLEVEGFWCNTSIKLPFKFRTPLGGNVTIVNICTDIQYIIDSGEINIKNVKMSSSSSIGNKSAINIASTRTGEAWYVSNLRPKYLLFDVIEKELKSKKSRLRKIMLNKWRANNRSITVQRFIDLINENATFDEISELDASSICGVDLVFKYTKTNTSSEKRYVTVTGLKGNTICARDHKDDKIKSFRIDRISKVRKLDS